MYLRQYSRGTFETCSCNYRFECNSYFWEPPNHEDVFKTFLAYYLMFIFLYLIFIQQRVNFHSICNLLVKVSNDNALYRVLFVLIFSLLTRFTELNIINHNAFASTLVSFTMRCCFSLVVVPTTKLTRCSLLSFLFASHVHAACRRL